MNRRLLIFICIFHAAFAHGYDRQRAKTSLAGELTEQAWAIGASYQIAEVFAWRGETGRAFEWLDRAWKQRDAGLRYLKIDPLLRKVRGDPRYAALLRKQKLPPD